jgi:hypothetical protein
VSADIRLPASDLLTLQFLTCFERQLYQRQGAGKFGTTLRQQRAVPGLMPIRLASTTTVCILLAPRVYLVSMLAFTVCAA